MLITSKFIFPAQIHLLNSKHVYPTAHLISPFGCRICISKWAYNLLPNRILSVFPFQQVNFSVFWIFRSTLPFIITFWYSSYLLGCTGSWLQYARSFSCGVRTLSCGMWDLVPRLQIEPGCSTRASLVAQSVKNLPAMQETRVWSLGEEDPLEKEMATHSLILAWTIPRTEEPGSLQSVGSQESDTT